MGRHWSAWQIPRRSSSKPSAGCSSWPAWPRSKTSSSSSPAGGRTRPTSRTRAGSTRSSARSTGRAAGRARSCGPARRGTRRSGSGRLRHADRRRLLLCAADLSHRRHPRHRLEQRGGKCPLDHGPCRVHTSHPARVRTSPRDTRGRVGTFHRGRVNPFHPGAKLGRVGTLHRGPSQSSGQFPPASCLRGRVARRRSGGAGRRARGRGGAGRRPPVRPAPTAGSARRCRPRRGARRR